MKFVILVTSVNSAKIARKLARELVSERLAACVSVVPNVQSTYHWRGKVEVAREQCLIIKTTRSQISRIERAFKSLHPYEVPELIAVSLTWVSARYGRWIEESLSGRSRKI